MHAQENPDQSKAKDDDDDDNDDENKKKTPAASNNDKSNRTTYLAETKSEPMTIGKLATAWCHHQMMARNYGRKVTREEDL
mmetsp:Transcript_83727/g.175151  ORF Transcript_83727/g.175151 Transcript_83727/m.175151 type:complete len:81 (+) Transcript_83727:146-388(+)|eukprot:CAMPEP_0206498582 /NCGR_PEP_ID=MMETSP0324_2-20121206/51106_1 /ASSEMBLY_ACC=CAM_ASM_000836 /TAXON_ID=2866 /ORGANISM="Crypthecodinium cohnii, Strain Seligo" /LENGTH=80 /DNA_ID=CAMNT_0053984849 /DNA_START=125 /DNA_END=367 /DNA_ORIENTATION=+